MCDLGTGESWRRLDEDPSVLRVNQDGKSFYHDRGAGPSHNI